MIRLRNSNRSQVVAFKDSPALRARKAERVKVRNALKILNENAGLRSHSRGVGKKNGKSDCASTPGGQFVMIERRQGAIKVNLRR